MTPPTKSPMSLCFVVFSTLFLAVGAEAAYLKSPFGDYQIAIPGGWTAIQDSDGTRYTETTLRSAAKPDQLLTIRWYAHGAYHSLPGGSESYSGADAFIDSVLTDVYQSPSSLVSPRSEMELAGRTVRQFTVKGSYVKNRIPFWGKQLNESAQRSFHPGQHAYTVIPNPRGFYALIFVAPADNFAKSKNVYENLLKSFQLLAAEPLDPTDERSYVAALPANAELIEALKSGGRDARIKAALELGKRLSAGKEVSAPLLKALRDSDSKVRMAAVRALGMIGPATRDVVPGVIRSLNDGDLEVRHAALDSVQRLGPGASSAIPDLIELFRDSDGEIRSHGARALGRIGTSALPELIVASKDADVRFRLSAAQALGELGPRARRSLPDLTRLLKDADQDVRAAAAEALGRLETGARGTAPELAAALKDEHASVRLQAARALGRIGPAAAAAVPELLPFLAGEGEQAELARAAAASLEQIGAPPEAAGALVAALKSEDKALSASAAAVLRKLGRASQPQLVALLKDEKPELRLRAAELLGSAGLDEEAVIPELIRALRDADERVNAAAVTSLGALGQTRDSRSKLVRALRDRSPLVRRAAAQALIGLGDLAELIADFIQALKEEDVGAPAPPRPADFAPQQDVATDLLSPSRTRRKVGATPPLWACSPGVFKELDWLRAVEGSIWVSAAPRWSHRRQQAESAGGLAAGGDARRSSLTCGSPRGRLGPHGPRPGRGEIGQVRP